jgi:integrase
MARHIIKSDVTIRNTKPKADMFRVSDGDGLYLLVKPDGAKWWRFDYSIAGKRKTISLGVYPDTTLSAARKNANEARQLVAADTDPSDIRKAAKQVYAKRREDEQRINDGLPASGSFEDVAREWATVPTDKRSNTQTEKIIGWMVKDVFPWLGRRPINEITTPEIDAVIQRIVDRGALDIARRTLWSCGRIFGYAAKKGYSQGDPTARLSEYMPSKKVQHHAAIVDPKLIGELLRAIDGYQGAFVTKCALRLAPMFFVRPGELRQAEWHEFDFDKAEWNIPAERMKMREPHLVPLSTQALEILRGLHALTGSERYVFPGARTASRPMSENAVLAALRRMGYSKDEMTGHGFRAMARTILDEVLHFRPDFIEHQLAHAVRDPNGRAYNRTAHLAERRMMMQQWADYLDKLKVGVETNVPIASGVN